MRLREDGDVLTGEAFVVPCDDIDLLNRLNEASDLANSLDWLLHDVHIALVSSLD